MQGLGFDWNNKQDTPKINIEIHLRFCLANFVYVYLHVYIGTNF